MRSLALVLLLVACDHRPPSKQQSPGGSAATVAADAGVPGDGLVIVLRDAGVVDPVCMEIGVKLADIIIAATTDEAQRAAYEQERTKLVRRFSETCQQESWPAATRTCFLNAKTASDVEVCSRDLVKPQPPAPAAGSGSGSAVH